MLTLLALFYHKISLDPYFSIKFVTKIINSHMNIAMLVAVITKRSCLCGGIIDKTTNIMSILCQYYVLVYYIIHH